ATADLARLKEPDIISISVPTPLSKTKDPDVSYVLAATESVKKALRKGQLVVLESTTYPGTTRELMLPALESTGLKVGEDFFLAFSPARVDPGHERFNTRNTPKVVGGHCIPLDPHYLAWKMRTLNYKTRFIELAGELNAEMPVFWVAKVVDTLNEQGKAVRGSRVLLLGVAYKKNIDDIRESPALDVIRLLHRRGAQISYHDPHVPTLNEDGITMNSVPLTAETLRGADCVMIITDHTAVDYQL